MNGTRQRNDKDMPTIGTIVRRPAWVLLVLLIALALNIGAAFLPISPGLKTGFHLIVAAVTVAFIAFIFMELEKKDPTIHLFAASGVVWIAILFLLIFSDYGARP
jgi:caa(3)-type oxidase subunit IV